jgi:hypothetical protein
VKKCDNFMPRSLYPGERTPGTHWIRGWVRSKAGVNAPMSLLEIEPRFLGHAAAILNTIPIQLSIRKKNKLNLTNEKLLDMSVSLIF